jgi:hypothetical protein
VNDLQTYWQQYPPCHVLLAAYVRGPAGLRQPRAGAQFEQISDAVRFAGGSFKGKLPASYRNQES